MKPFDELASDWPHISRLLDQVLDLPGAEREGLLAQLAQAGPADAVRAATLRRLLATPAAADARPVIDQLPHVPLQPLSPLLPPMPSQAAFTQSVDGSREPTAAFVDPHDQAGQQIGPYRLLRALGQGGMGTIWLAERADVRRQVALKLPHLVWHRDLAAQLRREQHILATLEHPNIARLYDVGVDDRGRPYMALEYVQGHTLIDYANAQRLTTRQRVQLLLQVAHAVAYAHSRLVIHRDLKPGNILVTADAEVRLLDFGIASLLQADSATSSPTTALSPRALTPRYASPEQVAGGLIGTTSDVYSLGVVGYELLTGQSPYRLKRGTPAEVEEAVLHTDPAPASSVAADAAARRALRGDLQAVLAQALHKAPAARYGSCDALAIELERWLAGAPVQARRSSALQRLWRLVQRHALTSAAIAGAVLLLMATTAVSWRQAQRAEQQALQARKEAARAVAVQGLMLDLFRMNSVHQSDPLRAQKTTALELLDIAAGRVGKALKDAPDSQKIGRAHV